MQWFTTDCPRHRVPPPVTSSSSSSSGVLKSTPLGRRLHSMWETPPGRLRGKENNNNNTASHHHLLLSADCGWCCVERGKCHPSTPRHTLCSSFDVVHSIAQDDTTWGWDMYSKSLQTIVYSRICLSTHPIVLSFLFLLLLHLRGGGFLNTFKGNGYSFFCFLFSISSCFILLLPLIAKKFR